MSSSSTQQSSAPISITCSKKTGGTPSSSKASSRATQESNPMSLNRVIHKVEQGSTPAGGHSIHQLLPPGKRNQAGGIPVVRYVSKSEGSGQPSASYNREGQGENQFYEEEGDQEEEYLVW